MKKLILILMMLCTLQSQAQNMFVSYYSAPPSTEDEFSPSDLDSLVLWLKADAGVTKDGSNYVSSWADQSGNGNNATQATGSAQPLWVDNQLNGKPVIRFDGANDFIKTPQFQLQQPFTVYVIFKIITTKSWCPIFDGNITNSSQFTLGPNADVFSAYSGLYQFGELFYTSGFHAAEVHYNGSSSFLNIDNLHDVIGITGTNSANGFTLGSYGSGVLYGNIEVAEVLIYSTKVLLEDKIKLADYILKKYNIIIGLPIVPQLSSNNEQDVQITYSSAYSANYDGWKAFNRNINDPWSSEQPAIYPEYVQIKFSTGKIPTKYIINAPYRNGETWLPKSWTLEGSNDGIAWTQLHTVTNHSEWKGAELFTFNNNSNYTYFRFVIIDGNGEVGVGINDMQLF